MNLLAWVVVFAAIGVFGFNFLLAANALQKAKGPAWCVDLLGTVALICMGICAVGEIVCLGLGIS